MSSQNIGHQFGEYDVTVQAWIAARDAIRAARAEQAELSEARKRTAAIRQRLAELDEAIAQAMVVYRQGPAGATGERNPERATWDEQDQETLHWMTRYLVRQDNDARGKILEAGDTSYFAQTIASYFADLAMAEARNEIARWIEAKVAEAGGEGEPTPVDWFNVLERQIERQKEELLRFYPPSSTNQVSNVLDSQKYYAVAQWLQSVEPEVKVFRHLAQQWSVAQLNPGIDG